MLLIQDKGQEWWYKLSDCRRRFALSNRLSTHSLGVLVFYTMSDYFSTTFLKMKPILTGKYRAYTSAVTDQKFYIGWQTVISITIE